MSQSFVVVHLLVLSSWNFADIDLVEDDEPETICCWFLLHVSPQVFMSVELN